MNVRTPIAVGGHTQEFPFLECQRTGSTARVPCLQHILQSATATADDPSILEVRVVSVDAERAQLDLKALKAGRTTLRVDFTDTRGNTYHVDNAVQALDITRIDLRPRCGDPTAIPPYLYPVSSLIQLTYELRAGFVPLAGDGVLPVDGGAFRLNGAGAPYAELTTPDTRQVGAITSPVDPTLHLLLETYEAGDVDTVTVQAVADAGVAPFFASEPPSGVPAVELSYSIGDRAICGHLGSSADGVVLSPMPNGVAYTVTASGPCAMQRDGGAQSFSRNARQPVYGLAEGPCLISAGIDGDAGQGTTAIWFRSPLVRTTDTWLFDNPTPQGNDVFALGAAPGGGDLWAGDEQGALHRWSGGQWRPFPTEPRQPISAIWGQGATDAWAGGALGTLLHWDGVAWRWVPTGLTETITGLWGNAFNNVWAVGSGGTILHADGFRWSRTHRLPDERFTSVTGTTGTSGTTIWFGSRTGVFRLTPSGQVVRELTSSSPGGYFVAGRSSNDVWAVGSTTYHWDGLTWGVVDTGGVELRRITIDPLQRIWALGDAGVYQWTGVTWLLVWAQPSLLSIQAAGNSEVWVAGKAGVMGRWNGFTWADVTGGLSPDGLQLNALWGSSEIDLWAVGRLASGPAGMILHRTSPGWSIAATSPGGGLNAVWGTGAGNVWAAGDQGTVLHLEGGAWTPVPSGTTKTIRAIWGSGANGLAPIAAPWR